MRSSTIMSPKGELSRHRTIIEEVGEDKGPDAQTHNPDASARRAVDTSTCLRGRVVKVHGLISIVLGDDGLPAFQVLCFAGAQLPPVATL